MARAEDPTQTLRYRTLEVATKPLVWLLINHLLSRVDIINNASSVTFTPDFPRIFCDHISAGRKPILATNHSSQFDIDSVIKLVQEIENQTGVHIEGWYLPVARSMSTGHQGPVIKSVQEYYKKRAKELAGIELVPVTSFNDRKKFGITTQDREWSRARKDSKTNGHGLIVFPEGRVFSGRSANSFWPFSEGRKGMQKPLDNSLDDIADSYSRDNIDPFYITAGLAGGYEVFTSRLKLPTLPAILALYHLHDPHFIDIQATVLGSLAQIRKSAGPDGLIAEPIMRSIASLLADDRRNLRGDYGQK